LHWLLYPLQWRRSVAVSLGRVKTNISIEQVAFSFMLPSFKM
jgi:hypothetical protein